MFLFDLLFLCAVLVLVFLGARHCVGWPGSIMTIEGIVTDGDIRQTGSGTSVLRGTKNGVFHNGVKIAEPGQRIKKLYVHNGKVIECKVK